MTAFEHEVQSICDEYARRSVAPQIAGEYSLFNPVHAALVLDRERAILAALSSALAAPLEQAEILDVGCGSGTSLALLAAYGATASNLHGVDILEQRVVAAHRAFPAFDVRLGDGSTLPFPDASFDLVQQITMLSSVHDPSLRARLAEEMVRVVRPGGIVLSYDVAPVGIVPRMLNRGLRLIRRESSAGHEGPAVKAPALTPVHELDEVELRQLFASLEPLELERLTPYRPLVERVVRRRTLLGSLLGARLGPSAVLYVGRRAGD